jgi:hypothetical protein
MLHPSELRLTLNELRSTLKNIMYPARRSFADLYHAYIVQQSNCRWNCERSCFLRLGLNNEKSIHTLLLQYLNLLSLHL